MKFLPAYWVIAFLALFSADAEGRTLTGMPCLSYAEPVVELISERSLRYCGKLTANGVQRAKLALNNSGVIKLQIASLGGEIGAPIDLAELVESRRLHVEVIGPCLSGCASHVFIAGKTRRVFPWGILGLHNTNTSAFMMAENGRVRATGANSQPLGVRAERERALYARTAVDPIFLLEPQVRIGTRCIRPEGSHERTGETTYMLVTDMNFWIPSKSQWKRAGVLFNGFSPKSAREAKRILSRTIPTLDMDKVVFGGPPLSISPEQELLNIGEC